MKQLWNNIQEYFIDTDTYEYALPILVLGIILFPFDGWIVSFAATSIFLFGLIHRPLVSHRYSWTVLAGSMLVTMFYLWPATDNHKYVLTTLTLGIAIVMWRKKSGLDIKKALGYVGIGILSIVMLLAFIQKISSSEYVSGTFFHSIIVMYEPIQSFSHFFTGLPNGLLEQNYAYVEQVPTGYTTQEEVLITNDRARLLGFFITWSLVLMELTIGLSFLFKRFQLVGHIALLLFIIVTYSIAPIYLFGWMLAVLGLLGTYFLDTKYRIYIQLGYIAVLLLLIALSTIPFFVFF